MRPARQWRPFLRRPGAICDPRNGPWACGHGNGRHGIELRPCHDERRATERFPPPDAEIRMQGNHAARIVEDSRSPLSR